MATSYRKPARKRLADMTPAEQLQVQIERVKKLGLRVVATGTFKADGSPFWLVPSTSEKLKNMHHVVKKTAKGLVCDCYACSESGLICPHRATVYLELKHQAEAAKPAPAPKLSPDRAAMSERERRETALPYTDDKPFSIFKSENAEGERVARDHYQHAYR